MEKSEQLNEIFTALSKAQTQFKPAVLDCYNPFHKAKYASLTSIQESYKEGLSANGLSVLQLAEDQDGKYSLKTILGHSSGQWISTTMKLLLSKEDMQGLGSAITYARRQAVSALLGIVDSGDDAGVGQARQATNEEGKKLAAETRAKIEEKEIMDRAKKNTQGHVSVTNYVAALKEIEKERKLPPPSTNPLDALPEIHDADLCKSADYKIRFGKDSGKTLKSLGVAYVRSKLTWCETEAKQPLTGPMAEFADHARLYLSAADKPSHP